MADAGVGEAMLASEAIGSSAAAAEGGGTLASLGAGGSFVPAAGESASLFSALPAAGEVGAGFGGASSLMGPTYAELGYNAMGPTYGELGYTGLGAGQAGPTYGELGYTGANIDKAAAEGNIAAQAAKDQMAKNPLSSPEFMKDPLGWMMKNKTQTALTAGGIYTLANILKGGALTKPNYLPQYNPVTAQQMGLARTMSPAYQPQTNAMYNRGYAEGGSVVPSQGVAPADLNSQQNTGIQSLALQYGINPIKAQQAANALGIKSAADGGLMRGGPANVDFMGGDMYPQSQIQRSYYATPSQMPTSAQQVAASYEPKTNPLTGQMTANMAEGGQVGQVDLHGTVNVNGATPNQAQGANGYAPAGGQAWGGGQYSSFSPTGSQNFAPAAGIARGIPMAQSRMPTYEDGFLPPPGIQTINTPAQSALMKAQGMASGGIASLGSYSDGGRLLKGPGDGMSDNIPATIAEKQPARLADGEFVVPADVVSHLGNGSTDAGAKQLYNMMDKVRKARTGRKQQGKQIKSEKYLPT